MTKVIRDDDRTPMVDSQKNIYENKKIIVDVFRLSTFEKIFQPIFSFFQLVIPTVEVDRQVENSVKMSIYNSDTAKVFRTGGT